MHRKVRVLGIAPYDNMKALMLNLAQERDDVELTVFVGDLQQGVELAKRNFYNDYDAIVSRGGTAQLLQKELDLPVVEIAVTPFDIMRAMKLAESVSDQYAIVGFPGVTASAKQLCQLMQYRIDIHTIQNEEQAEKTLLELRQKGTGAILCDMVTNRTAMRLGLNVVLITSGPESIQAAFDDAVRLCRCYDNLREENRFLRSIIWNQINHTLVFDDWGEIFFSTLENNALPIVDSLREERNNVPDSEEKRILKRINNIQYDVRMHREVLNDHPYVACYFSESRVPSAELQRGIRLVSQQDAEQEYNGSLYGMAGLMRDLQASCAHLNQSSQPIMVCGEAGCLKEQVVNYLYMTSSRHNCPLVIIDCFLLNDKAWNYLVNHYNSPLAQSGCTIFLKSVDVLSPERRRQILANMLAMDICKRNRVVFSCVCQVGESVTEAGKAFVEHLGCLVLYLPPMREYASQISAAANICLSNLNIELTKQLLGLEPGAVQLLHDFDWPGNHAQFQRILRELAIMTDGPYITQEDTAQILQRERTVAIAGQRAECGGQRLNLEGTLEQINSEIIRCVLEEENGNQSRTARRLGISRTTLWRLLSGR
ncbi:PrpR N-terminal domain-containing protein [Lawsonibacter sp. LCP25S3_G6]|uniref:sigma-54-dependent transcriptional regulator n=1 Tax=unclassified Lawsonibacter TaxID=2617946 RepID=UPI003F99C8D8